MFGAESKKITGIELFSKLGLVGKTITQTKEGNRTEDTKLFPIDFDEWLIENQLFENSTLYGEFSENQFLFFIFEEPSPGAKLLDNKFIGFKRVSFDEGFIESEVKRCWSEVREKVFSNTLEEVVLRNKQGHEIINKNGQKRTTINFPKSKDGSVFLRGTGTDSRDKPVVINGISMYRQNVWIKGKVINQMLNSQNFI